MSRGLSGVLVEGLVTLSLVGEGGEGPDPRNFFFVSVGLFSSFRHPLEKEISRLKISLLLIRGLQSTDKKNITNA